MTKPIVNLILDSGAFSAYTKGIAIDIDKYADFAKRNINNVGTIVNLDSIQPKNPLAGAEESLKNFRYLHDKHNLLTMPVFHQGEPIKYLYTMMEEANYIGLAVRGSCKGESKVFDWYNSIWPLITDKDGFPVRRFHAFGDTSVRSMLRYPWYSADSSSCFLVASRHGKIIMNDIPVQFRTRTAKSGTRYADVGDGAVKRESWETALINYGLDPRACSEPIKESELVLIRSYFNVCYFLELEQRAITTDRYIGSLPIEALRYSTGGKQRVDPLKIHLAMKDLRINLPILGVTGVTQVLLSYFYIAENMWNEQVVPFLYDPLRACVENKKIAAKVEVLNKYLLKPVIV